MRFHKVLLTFALTTAVAGATAASTLALALPGSSYPWAQPNAALPTASCTQPPAWVPIVARAPVGAAPGCSYVWAQPGTAVQPAGYAQPPAWVPIAPSKPGS